jgi:hypothetical protein
MYNHQTQPTNHSVANNQASLILCVVESLLNNQHKADIPTICKAAFKYGPPNPLPATAMQTAPSAVMAVLRICNRFAAVFNGRFS